jgi:hypothetical protein
MVVNSVLGWLTAYWVVVNSVLEVVNSVLPYMPFLFWMSSPFCSALVDCPCSPVLATLSWQPCPGNFVLVHVLEVLSLKSRSACPILAVLF